jgi:hypothetical protein
MRTERTTKAVARRRSVQVGDKKLAVPVTLFAAIEADQHEALRTIAFAERRSLADVVREALTTFLAQHPARRRRVAANRSLFGGAAARHTR